MVENTSFNTNNSPSDPNRFVYRIIDLEAGGKIRSQVTLVTLSLIRVIIFVRITFYHISTTRPGIELPFDDIELGDPA